MQSIEKFEFKEEPFKHVVLITTLEDPYYLQDEIYEVIANPETKEFSVLVDLFLRNGFSFNRYSLFTYDVNKSCKSTIINPRQVPDFIKRSVKIFLINKPDILNESALSKKTLDFVRKT